MKNYFFIVSTDMFVSHKKSFAVNKIDHVSTHEPSGDTNFRLYLNNVS